MQFELNETAMRVADYLNVNMPKNDAEFHQWAESQGFDVPKAEFAAYQLARLFVQFMYGGRAAEKGLTKKDVDAKELKAGIEIEHEHTSNDEEAERISLDHEAEFPKDAPLKYYVALPLMEKLMKRLTKVDKKEADEAIEAFRRLAEGDE
jgi:hypothetical protein